MSTERRAWKRCRPLWFRLPRFLRIFWIGLSMALGPVQQRWCFQPDRIRALLLVRDLYSSLPALVDALLAQGLQAGHILLLDSGSTQPACLDMLSSLEQRGCRWIRLTAEDQRFGPYASWMCPELQREIRSWRYPYLVSDTDLAFPDPVPTDWLTQLFASLNRHRGVLKVALPLQITDITADNRHFIRCHELRLMQRPLYRWLTRSLLGTSASAVVCTTDTTMALYRPSTFFSTLSIRLRSQYSMHHLPWYLEFVESAEYLYYQSRKNPRFGEWS